jgi:hypothetical protein
MKCDNELTAIRSTSSYGIPARRIRLPIDVEAMRFGNLSGVSERDLDQAEARVRAHGATFPQYLAQHVSFHKFLERWAPERFAAAEAELAEAVEHGTYAARVERRIEAAGPGLSDDSATTSQAGRAVLEELQEHVFGPLVRACLGPVKR